jgi:CheY-like chemotaxis protein
MRRKKVLFVDDDELDLMFVKEALEINDIQVEASFAHDAPSALEKLKSEALPDLIVTDLCMPGMDGAEFTETLKRTEKYRHVPVLMLSTSNALADIRTFYDKYGNAYICKPSSPDGYANVVKAIKDFWVDLVP